MKTLNNMWLNLMDVVMVRNTYRPENTPEKAFEYDYADDMPKTAYQNSEIIEDKGNGVKVLYREGNIYWYKNGIQHRDGGPAVEFVSGYKAWYQYGKLHREDGPAIEQANGYKAWYLNDIIDRNDKGPVVINADGECFFKDGEEYYDEINYMRIIKHKQATLDAREELKKLGYIN